jgi:hypothetical protein
MRPIEDIAIASNTVGEVTGSEKEIIRQILEPLRQWWGEPYTITRLQSNCTLRVIPLQGFVGGHRLEYIDLDLCRWHSLESEGQG